MLPPDRRSTRGATIRQRLMTRPALLAGVVIVAIAVHFAPTFVIAALRDSWNTILLPSQRACAGGLDLARGAVDRVAAWFADGERLAATTAELEALQAKNQRLAAQLEAARVQVAEARTAVPSDGTSAPLLRIETTHARVLGRQAQSFLRGQCLLDLGSRKGAASGAFVIDASGGDDGAPPVIDAGGDLALSAGGVVLAGRRIWGRLAAVGVHTSTVERITDRGYRDTVRIAHAIQSEQSRLGPRGMLVGNGEPLCRIELVATTEPIALGDLVLAAEDGMLDEPLIYGHVSRVEQPAAGGHWQIWMTPAVGSEPPRNVAVLRFELNPVRIANAGSPGGAPAPGLGRQN